MANPEKPKSGYAYLGIPGAKSVTPSQIAKGEERLRHKLLPDIQLQVKKKEEGAEEARTLKIF